MAANATSPPVPNFNVTAQVAAGRLEPLRPMPVATVTRAMAEYQSGLQALLADSDWQVFVGSNAREQRFVKRSGWRKIATWFGLDLLVDDTTIVVSRDQDGRPLRARVKARAVAPNGRIAEDVGACSIDERRFSKPEHDLVATATTRALNRAISNLVGMGEVSAEEIGDADLAGPPELPDWAQEADQLDTTHERLVELVGQGRADALLRAIAQRYDGVPNIAVGFVTAIHSMLAPELKTAREQGE